jgi:hypothetical protein
MIQISFFQIKNPYGYINYSKDKKTLMSSEINNYRCEECGISFSSQRELQEHNNQEHIGTA